MNHTTESSDRVSIWSVDRDDLNFFSYVFPIAVAFNCLYYLVIMVNWAMVGWLAGTGQFLLAVGALGVSAATISLITMVIRRVIMVLFDWPSKRERTRRKALEEGRAEGREVLIKELLENGVAVLPGGVEVIVVKPEDKENHQGVTRHRSRVHRTRRRRRRK